MSLQTVKSEFGFLNFFQAKRHLKMNPDQLARPDLDQYALRE